MVIILVVADVQSDPKSKHLPNLRLIMLKYLLITKQELGENLIVKDAKDNNVISCH